MLPRAAREPSARRREGHPRKNVGRRLCPLPKGAQEKGCGRVATLGNMPDIPCGPRLASGRLWARYSRMILNLNEPNAPGAPLIGHHETSGHVSNYERQLSDAFSLYGHLGVTMVKTGYVADTRRLKRNDERGVEHFEYHDGQFAVGHHLRVSRLRVREHQSSTV